jgi:hypothetical protein
LKLFLDLKDNYKPENQMVDMRHLKRQKRKLERMQSIDEENERRRIRDARVDEDGSSKLEERKEEKKLVYIESSSSCSSS